MKVPILTLREYIGSCYTQAKEELNQETKKIKKNPSEDGFSLKGNQNVKSNSS